MNLTFGILLSLLITNCNFPNATGTLLSSILFSSNEELNYSPFYKGAVCTPSAAIQHPTTIKELLEIVNDAIREENTVKAFGIRHSLTDIICTDGIPVDMHGIRGMTMNPDDSVTVAAGENLYDLTEFLNGHGRGLRMTPGFGNITIGGAIGTGAHGSSIKYTSSISEQVIGLTIIDGQGEIREISDEADLRAFRIHLGLLGIVISVTLRTVPLYKVVANNYVVSDDILFNGTFLDMVISTDQISLYWFPSFNQVVVANWTIVDVETVGEAWTNDHVPSTYPAFNAINVPLIEGLEATDNVQGLNLFQKVTQDTLLGNVPGFVPIYTEDGITVKMPAVGYYHRMFAPICDDKGNLQCPWFHGPFNFTILDNEIGLDMRKVPEMARMLKDVVSKYPAVFPFQGILLRFSVSGDTMMSMSYGRDTCHFEFLMPNVADSYDFASSGLAAYQTILQSLIFDFGGRSHWGKTGAAFHSTEILERNLDPLARTSFLEYMDIYDPNGIFMNKFGRRLKGEGTENDIDPKVTHCALLDNCFCSSFRDCALGQECSTLEGYPNYPSCITPNRIVDFLDPTINFTDWLLNF